MHNRSLFQLTAVKLNDGNLSWSKNKRSKGYKMLINSIPNEIQILVLTIILFVINLLWNWLIYKTKGPSRCPVTSTLIDREYDLTYGMISATPFIFLAVIVYIVYSEFGVQSISFTKTAYYTVGFYVLLSIAFNLWGQRFLRKRGVNPKPEGWKGFWKTYMENLKKYKETHSGHK
jgi:hypothetical protein